MPVHVDIPGVGVVEFPDSMSSDDVNAAAKRLHDEYARAPRMSAATAGTALPDTADARHEATWGMKPLLPEGVRNALNKPLIHPTGIDVVDSLSSPTNLALMFGPVAARTAGRVAGAIPRPSGAQVLQAAKFVRHPVRESVKMGADAIISHLDEAAARQATAPPIASPAASQPAVAPIQSTTPVTKAVFNPGDALTSAKEAFTALGEVPRPAEASNAMEFIRRGASPADAVARVIAKRPALSPAEELAAKLGTLSDAEVRAALDLRNARGEIKSPSAETARARKGR